MPRRTEAPDPLAARFGAAVKQARTRRGETLEDVISSAWEGLAAHDVVACPACRGQMVPRYGSGGTAVGGRCVDCGTTLG